MRGLIAASLSLVMGHSAMAQENVMLVLDASGSMWGQIEGRSKVEIARDAVADMLREWRPEDALGLLAYGHRRRGDCEDIELLMPPAPLQADSYMAKVNGLNARGMTPLSAAVIQAAEALRSSEQKATVILVSDGEGNCAMDPCEVGARLAAEGIDFTAHVIGFDVGNPQHQAQLRCLAESTGGRYFNASDAAELRNSLSTLAQVSTATSRAPLPAASASLSAPDQAPAASRLEISYEGPGDERDYIALVDGDDAERAYSWVTESEDQTLVMQLPARTGAYELRYVSPMRESSVLARRAITLTPVQALIEAPANVPQGSMVPIRAEGPHDRAHWIAIAAVGAPVNQQVTYQHVSGAVTELQLPAPSGVGSYEIRYVLEGADEPLAVRALQVVEAEAMVSAPERVSAGEQVSVRASGPADGAHWITFAEAGSDDDAHLAYRYVVQGQHEYALNAPSEPGTYELRYVLANPSKVVARQRVDVVASEVRFDAPAEGVAGQEFAFTAHGPVSPGNWVTIVAADAGDSGYSSYEYTNSEGRYSLMAPEQPGAYELRYVLETGQVIGRQRVQLRAP